MSRRAGRPGERFYRLVCIGCGQEVREGRSSTRCPTCRKPLDVRYDTAYIRARLNRYSLKSSPIKALKDLDFFPIRNLDLVISLNDRQGRPAVHGWWPPGPRLTSSSPR